MPEFLREAQAVGLQCRPTNDGERDAEREDLERRIATALAARMRTPTMMDRWRMHGTRVFKQGSRQRTGMETQQAH